MTRLDFGGPARAGGSAAASGGGGRGRGGAIEDVADFILADANGDGVLTMDEVDAYGARKGMGAFTSSAAARGYGRSPWEVASSPPSLLESPRAVRVFSPPAPSSVVGGLIDAMGPEGQVARKFSAIESELTVLKGTVEGEMARADLRSSAEDSLAVVRLAHLAQAEVAASTAWRAAELHRMQTEYRYQVAGYVATSPALGVSTPSPARGMPGAGTVDALEEERLRLESSRLKFEAELGVLESTSVRRRREDELERERIRAMLGGSGSQAHLQSASKDAERARHAVERERRLLEEERQRLDAEVGLQGEVRKERALRKLRRSRLWAGYNSWKIRTEGVLRKRRMVGRAVGHARNLLAAKAWRSWCFNVEERRQRRARGRQAAGRIANGVMARAFARLHEAAAQAIRRRETGLKAIGHLKNRKLATSLSGWAYAVVESLHRRELARKSAVHFTNRATCKAWARLVEHTMQCADAKRALSHWREGLLHKALLRWIEAAAQLMHLREISTRAVRRLQKITMHRGLEVLLANSSEQRLKRKKVRVAVLLFSKRALGKAFNSWMGHAEDMARLHSSAYKVSSRFNNRLLSVAFESLQEVTAYCIRCKHIVGGATKRMRSRHLSKAFERWQHLASDSGWRRAMGNKAANFFVDGQLSAGFYLLQSRARYMIERRNKLSGAVKRMSHRNLSLTFERWQHLASDSCRLQDLGQKAANFFANRQLSVGFYLLQSRAQYMIERRNKLSGAAKRLQHNNLSRAFERWQWLSDNAARLHALGDKAMRRIRSMKLAIAYATLQENVILRAQARNAYRETLSRAAGYWAHVKQGKAFRSWIKRMEMIRSVRRVGVRLQNMELATAWTALAAYTTMRRQRKNTMLVAGRKIIHRKVGMALRTWRKHAILQQRARRVASRMKNSAYAMVWDTLVDRITVRRRRRELVDRAAKQLKNSLLAKATARWVESVEESIVMRGKLEQVVEKWEAVHVRRSWSALCEFVRERRRTHKGVLVAQKRWSNTLGSKAFRQWAHQAHSIKNARKAVLRARNSRLSRGFESLLSFTAKRTDTKAKVRRARTHWMGGAKVRAFETWAFHTSEGIRLEAAAIRVVNRVRLNALARAFSGLDHAAQKRIEQRKSVSRAVAALKSRYERKALNQWVHVSQELSRARELGKKAVSRARKAALFSAMRALREATDDSIKKRERVQRAAAAWMSRAARKVMNRWIEFTDQTIAGKEMGLRAVKRMKHAMLGAAFDTLRESVYEQIEQRHNAERAVGAFRMRLARAALNSWVDAHANVIEAGMRKAGLAFSNQLLRKVMNSWMSAIVERRHKRDLAAKSLGRLMHREMAAAWAGLVHEVQVARPKMRMAIAACQNREMRKAWVSWTEAYFAGVQRRREEREEYERQRAERVAAARQFAGLEDDVDANLDSARSSLERRSYPIERRGHPLETLLDFNMADINGMGTLSFNEFKLWITPHRREPRPPRRDLTPQRPRGSAPRTEDPLPDARDLFPDAKPWAMATEDDFRRADTDKDGVLTVQEFSRFIRQNKQAYTAASTSSNRSPLRRRGGGGRNLKFDLGYEGGRHKSPVGERPNWRPNGIAYLGDPLTPTRIRQA